MRIFLLLVSLLTILIKLWQNKKDQIFVWAAPKMFFSQLPAVKKDTIFGAAQTISGPSYFVRALGDMKKVRMHFWLVIKVLDQVWMRNLKIKSWTDASAAGVGVVFDLLKYKCGCSAGVKPILRCDVRVCDLKMITRQSLAN